VFYSAKGSLVSPPYAFLDVDDTSGEGPETITISRQQAGVYRYSVFDYTNQSNSASTALGASGARVQVFRSNGLVAEFAVPAQPGTLWTVFEMEGSTSEITPVNTMTFAQPASTSRVPGAIAGASLSIHSMSTDAAVIAGGKKSAAAAPRAPRRNPR
jgi:hypothetical protein